MRRPTAASAFLELLTDVFRPPTPRFALSRSKHVADPFGQVKGPNRVGWVCGDPAPRVRPVRFMFLILLFSFKVLSTSTHFFLLPPHLALRSYNLLTILANEDRTPTL